MAEELDGGQRRGGTLNEKQRILLRMAVDIVETQYNSDPSDTTLEKTANYVLRLSKHKDKAMEDIADGGSGSVADPTSASLPTPYDFTVTASSFISTNATTKTFPSIWRGFNIIFVRNHVTQSTVNEGGTYYTWDRNLAILTLAGGVAQDTEIFQIYPI